jgi:hypothetical protein
MLVSVCSWPLQVLIQIRESSRFEASYERLPTNAAAFPFINGTSRRRRARREGNSAV